MTSHYGASATQATPLIQEYQNRLAAAPDAIVARTEEGDLSMSQLNRAAMSLAGKVGKNGAARSEDKIVGVFAYPGFDLLSSIWGALLSGSAYCPLSPDYPEDRLRYMIERSGMSVIICEAGLEQQLREIAGDGIQIITPHYDDAPNGDLQSVEVQPSELAYVIFTSGSTGRP